MITGRGIVVNKTGRFGEIQGEVLVNFTDSVVQPFFINLKDGYTVDYEAEMDEDGIFNATLVTFVKLPE